MLEVLTGERVPYRVLVGRPGGERPFGRHRCRLEDNIEMDLQNVVWGGMDWIVLAKDRDRSRAPVNAVMCLWVP
jgi:hypothetical protein